MKKRSYIKRLRVYCVSVCVLSLLLMAAISVSAQAPTAVILGTVKDTSGGTVAGANVTVTNTDTGLSRSQPTLDDGSYRFNALPVGNWSVSIMKEGFQTYKRTGLDLVVGQEAVIDATLQVGATGQTVTVTGEAPVVNTTNATLGTVVDEVKVEDLPLNGRNFVDLTLLQPGVVQTSIFSSPYGQGGTVYSSNGATVRSNMTTIDGANMTTLMGLSSTSALYTTLGIDGIKEYKVITNQFSAEYGLTSGSQSVIVSKGGGNQWHGDAFEYLRNDKLDANDFFNTVDYKNARGLPCDANGDKLLAFPCLRIPPYKKNNFGGSFGGPIKKDKAFFYGVYEGLRERFSPVTTATVFPLGCFYGRDTAGGADYLHVTNGVPSFPGVIDNIPRTSTSGANANPWSTVINKIPTACATVNTTNVAYITVGGGESPTPGTPNPALLAQLNHFLPIWPLPLPGLGGMSGLSSSTPAPTSNIVQPLSFNYQFPFVQPSREDYEQLRLDDDINAKDSAFLRYTVDWSSQFPYGVLPDWYNHNRSLSAIGTVSETHIISPTMLNQSRLSFSRTDLALELKNYTGPNGTGTTPNPATVLIPGNLRSGNGPSPGQVSANSTAGNSSASTVGNISQNIWQVSDDIFWNKGKHAFKFGTLINHYTGLFRAYQAAAGSVSYGNLDNFFQGQWTSSSAHPPGGGGAPIPTYITNATNGFGNFELQDREYWWNTLGFYVQDDYRVLPRVTLNLGLRYEFMTLPQAPPGLSYTVLNPSVPVPCTIPPGKFGCSGPGNGQGTPGNLLSVNTSLHNFSPRVGFAWDVFGNGKTALRGGAAIMYDIAYLGGAIAGNATQDPSLSPPVSISITYPKGWLNGPPIPLTIAPNCFTPVCDANSFQNLGATPCTNGSSLQATPFCSSNGQITVASNVRISDYKTPQPSMGEWNLTLDRQLPYAMDLTVSYVGTKAWHAIQTEEANPTPPSGIGANGLPFFCSASKTSIVEATMSTPCVTNNLNNRNNTNLGGGDWFTANGDSYYQGLQTSLQKRLSNGLSFQVAYTYAKLLDDGVKSNYDGGGASPSDGQTAAQYGVLYIDKGASFADVRHNLRVNAIYHIPDLKSDHFYAGFLRGWWISDITSYQTGFPINIVDGGSRDLTSNAETSGARPNLDPSFDPNTVVTGIIGTNSWFNTTMFDLEPPGTFGNAPRNSIRGPKLSASNISINKDTRLKWLGEAGSLQIRVEMFNAFNHPSFNAPSGSLGWTPTSAGAGLDASGQFQDARFPLTSPPTGPKASGGAITATSVKARNIQLAAKIVF